MFDLASELGNPVIGDILELLAIILGPTGIITLLLGRKNANKKLELTGDQVQTDRWEVLQTSYSDMFTELKEQIKEAKDSTKAALDQLAEYEENHKKLATQFDEQTSNFIRFRTLFIAVLKRLNTEMTTEEQAEFDATTPIRRTKGK